MLEQRQVTNLMESLARFADAGRSTVASMPMVALAAVAASTLHGMAPGTGTYRSVVADTGPEAVFAAPAQTPPAIARSVTLPGAAGSAAISADGIRAGALTEIERHLARARHAAANRSISPAFAGTRPFASAANRETAPTEHPEAIPAAYREMAPAVHREAIPTAYREPRFAASSVPSDARVVATRQAAARDPAVRRSDSGRLPLDLSREQRNIASFIAAKYRVAYDDVQKFVAHAYRAAREFRIDPHLILAVVSIESNFNPNARSAKGAQGLMQVLTRVHTDKFAPFGGAAAAFDPVANITVGSAILKEYLVREGSVEGALKSYVGAALLPHDFGYGRKVLSERQQIAAAGRGGSPTGPDSRTAAATAAETAGRGMSGVGVSAGTAASGIPGFDASEGRLDIPPAGNLDLRGADAVAQLMDRLHD